MAKALLETTLKRCGVTILLPPKDILRHCTWSLTVTSTVYTVQVFARARRKPFAGTGAPKQRVTLELQTSCRAWARVLTQQQLPTTSPPLQ